MVDGNAETQRLLTIYRIKCSVSELESLISVGFIRMKLYFQDIRLAREHKSTFLPTIPLKWRNERIVSTT